MKRSRSTSNDREKADSREFGRPKGVAWDDNDVDRGRDQNRDQRGDRERSLSAGRSNNNNNNNNNSSSNSPSGRNNTNNTSAGSSSSSNNNRLRGQDRDSDDVVSLRAENKVAPLPATTHIYEPLPNCIIYSCIRMYGGQRRL